MKVTMHLVVEGSTALGTSNKAFYRKFHDLPSPPDHGDIVIVAGWNHQVEARLMKLGPDHPMGATYEMEIFLSPVPWQGSVKFDDHTTRLTKQGWYEEGWWTA